MANLKISQLTEDTAPTHDDLIVTVNDPAGTPTSKRSKLSSLFAAMQTWMFGADAGANDTYVVTLSPVPASYVTGQHYRFKANTANTGACTVNFNGLGAKTIKKAAGGITTDLADNDIRAGQWVDVVYDGTNMQMQSQLGNVPSGGSGGVGDVVGPSSATDNALVRYDTTTGKLIQNSTVTLDDTGALTVPEMAAPSTPGAAKVALYAKADGLLYSKDDAGTETLVSGGTGGGGGSYAGVTTGGTGSLDMAQGTKTADEPFIDASVTWNNGSVNFNGIKINTTITTGGAGSKLLDLQVGGTSQVSVKAVSGTTQWALAVPVGSNSRPGLSFQGDDSTGLSYSSNIEFNVGGGVAFRVNGGDIHIIPAGGIEQRNGGPYRWQSSTRILSASNANLRIDGNSDDTHPVSITLGDSGNANGIRLKQDGGSSTATLYVKNSNDTGDRYLVDAGRSFVSAQFDKTNTTLADITGLTSPTLAAGKTYAFEAVLFVDADVVGGSKYAIAGTATATAIKYEVVFISDSANSMVITSRQTALGGSAGQAGTAAGICRISGTITVNAAGTLTVQFAQNAANGTSSVLTMSRFDVRQLN